MTATKDVDLREQAEERARDALLEKALLNYSESISNMANYDPPAQIAPQEYTETATDPSTYPLSLKALSTKFKGNNRLTGLAGQAIGVPKSPPIAMSDFLNKGLNYRVNGRINIDRYDDILGAGLFPNPSATWDRNDSTFFPAIKTQGAGGAGWNNVIINSWEFLESLIGSNGKVTNIRTLTLKMRLENTALQRKVNWIGLYSASNGSLEDLTYTYNGDALVYGFEDYSLPLVVAGKTQTPVKSEIGQEAVRMDAVRSHIENGFLSRISLTAATGEVDRIVDYHVIADFDVAPR